MTFIWRIAVASQEQPRAPAPRRLVAFVEGDKARGQQLLGEAAENAPDDLRKVADIVVLLGNIPGAKQYAGPVYEVAEVLRSRAAEAPSASAGGRRASERKGSAEPGDASGGSAAAAAGGDGPAPVPMRTRQAGHVTLSSVPQKQPCAEGGETGTCMRTALGPLVVTDVSLSPECAGGASVLAVPIGEPPSRAREVGALRGDVGRRDRGPTPPPRQTPSRSLRKPNAVILRSSQPWANREILVSP